MVAAHAHLLMGSSSCCPGHWASSSWAAGGVQAVLCLLPGSSCSCNWLLWPWALCRLSAYSSQGHAGGSHPSAVDAPGEQMGPTGEEVL